MAELLLDWKVPYVFGLGGSEEVGFLDALVDRLDLQYVHGLHEGSVMSMADGYARATGDVPIMNFHSVAGAAYSLGPMVNAFKDRIPLVVTVGRQSTDIRGANAFLESVNLHQLPQEYTQWTWDVMSTETIPEVVRRAFVLAQSPPGGPTFLTFSKDLWKSGSTRPKFFRVSVLESKSTWRRTKTRCGVSRTCSSRRSFLSSRSGWKGRASIRASR